VSRPAHQHTHLDTAADDLRDMIRDLTRTTTHHEGYTVKRGSTTWRRDHITTVPPLLWQLEHATPTKAGDTSPGGFRSQPAAWLESLDTMARIDLEASRWVTDMGESDDGTTSQVVARLGSLLPSAHRCPRPRGRLDGEKWCCTWHAVAHDVRRWHTQALIVTGWQSPAWRPNNTCPMCGKRGGLRVRLSDQSAMCVECREVWQAGTIGLLAEHIRGENLEMAVAGDAPDGEAGA
jgi:hypothetical protein